MLSTPNKAPPNSHPKIQKSKPVSADSGTRSPQNLPTLSTKWGFEHFRNNSLLNLLSRDSERVATKVTKVPINASGLPESGFETEQQRAHGETQTLYPGVSLFPAL
jgi:hypothetical protein